MAVLDIIVTNSSLRDIAGTLAASSDEISWVPTSYLVAEIVVIPLTAWLAAVFSLRNYLLVNSILFVVFSICCGQAHSLSMMILFRALQGFTGGVLIPLSFTVILTHLPPSKHAVGMAMFSVTAVFAPAVGPLIGGWLTDSYGWPYIFYLNIIPGILLVASVWFALDKEPMNLGLLKKGDWWGIATMAIGLASLEIVLEDGNRKDWFGDPEIVRLAWIAALAIISFVIIELRSKDPLVDLRLFGRRNFALGSVVNIVLGCRPLRFRLYPASVFRLGSRIQCPRNREGHHLDGNPSTGRDPADSDAHEARGCSPDHRGGGAVVWRQHTVYIPSQHAFRRGAVPYSVDLPRPRATIDYGSDLGHRH